MDSSLVKNAVEPRSVDPVWTRIREAAQTAAAAEPVLAGVLHATILSQPKFEGALSYHLARLVGTTEVPAALIRQTFEEAFVADPSIGMAARADIVAVTDRDPACTSHLDPLLWFKATMRCRPIAWRIGCGWSAAGLWRTICRAGPVPCSASTSIPERPSARGSSSTTAQAW